MALFSFCQCQHQQRFGFLFILVSTFSNVLLLSAESDNHFNVNTPPIYTHSRQHQRPFCQDISPACQRLLHQPELCQNNVLLHSYCPNSCAVCHNRTRTLPATLALEPPRRESRPIVNAVAANLGGVPQLVNDYSRTARTATKKHVLSRQIISRIFDTQDYLQYTVHLEDRYRSVRTSCRNHHEQCTIWALQNHCSKRPEFMVQHCPLVCEFCHELHYEARCPVDPDVPHAFYPGDLDRLFRRLTTHPELLSLYNITVLSRDPWIVQLHNFATPSECRALVDLGRRIGYERSTDVGSTVHSDGLADDVVSDGRTSTTAWCDDTCDQDTDAQAVLAKIEHVTHTHRNYSENVQLLRYETGQYYKYHHDYIGMERLQITGVRVLTLFIYLNDVEEGGETLFTDLGIKITPRQGAAILWPSVRNDDPHEKDRRTHHEALPVRRGRKYAANAWIHQRHARVAALNGC